MAEIPINPEDIIGETDVQDPDQGIVTHDEGDPELIGRSVEDIAKGDKVTIEIDGQEIQLPFSKAELKEIDLEVLKEAIKSMIAELGIEEEPPLYEPMPYIIERERDESIAEALPDGLGPDDEGYENMPYIIERERDESIAEALPDGLGPDDEGYENMPYIIERERDESIAEALPDGLEPDEGISGFRPDSLETLPDIAEAIPDEGISGFRPESLETLPDIGEATPDEGISGFRPDSFEREADIDAIIAAINKALENDDGGDIKIKPDIISPEGQDIVMNPAEGMVKEFEGITVEIDGQTITLVDPDAEIFEAASIQSGNQPAIDTGEWTSLLEQVFGDQVDNPNELQVVEQVVEVGATELNTDPAAQEPGVVDEAHNHQLPSMA